MSRKHRKAQPVAPERAAKREKFESSENKPLSRNPLIVFGVVAIIGLAVYVALMGKRSSTDDHFTRVDSGKDLRISLASLKLDEAQFFSYPSASGKNINFFLLRGSDGVVRAAYDACDVCYPHKQGYYQQGDNMVCRRCGRAFPSTKVNVVTGGCNPAPLERSTEGDQLVITAQNLEAGNNYF